MICKNCGNEIADGVKFCTACGTATAETEPAAQEETAVETAAPAAAAVEQPAAQEEKAPEKKKKGAGLLIVLAALVVLGGLAAAALYFLPGLLGAPVMCVYYTDDGELMYIDKFNGKGEGEEITDEEVSDVYFSEDGRYIYFIEDDDGTLFSMKVSSIGKKNAEAEKIDSDVYDVTLLDSGDLLYETYDEELFVYNGKDRCRLAKNVYTWSYYAEENAVYYQQSKNGLMSLYRIEAREDAEEEEIVENVYMIYHISPGGVVYLEQEDDGSYTVYSVVPGEEEEKLLEGLADIPVSVKMNGETTAVYYYQLEQVEYMLYDFVTDNCAEEDEGITKPYKSDYQKYVSSYWGGGYWTTDYAAYNEAYDRWEEKSYRDYLRDELKNYPYVQTYKSLYRYEGGESTPVLEDVYSIVYMDSADSIYLYRKNLRDLQPVCDVADLYYASEVEYYLYESFCSEALYVSMNGRESEFEVGNIDISYGISVSRLSEEEIMITGNNTDGEYCVWSCNAADDTLNDRELVVNCVSGVRFGMYNEAPAVFFYEDVDYSGGSAEGTLSCYVNGECVEVAEDARAVLISAEPDMVIVGQDYENDTYTFLVLTDDDEIEIGEEIEMIELLESGDAMYISDSDLYYFNGKESVRIDKDVTDFIINKPADTDWYFCN